MAGEGNPYLTTFFHEYKAEEKSSKKAILKAFVQG